MNNWVDNKIKQAEQKDIESNEQVFEDMLTIVKALEVA
jgi:hypothetical protein